MKKITFLILITASFFLSFEASAQLFDLEDFNSLTLGNIGTDPDGNTPGQGGLLTITGSGVNTDFQVIDSGVPELGNILQFIGSDETTDVRYLWKDGLEDFWNNTRTSGNDVLEVDFVFFTGGATTSKNELRLEIYDAGFTKIIAGLIFYPETKIIQGMVYANGGSGLGTYIVSLGAGATSDAVLLEDSFYPVGVAFDVATGTVTFRSVDFYISFPGAAMNNIPFEADLSVYPGAGNTASSVSFIDNFKIRAVDTEMLLGTTDNELSQSVKVFPNPVNNVVNLSLTSNIIPTKIEIVDVNGRIVKSINNTIRNQIDVSELSKGLYLLNIYSIEGKATKKFMKN